MCLNMLYDEWAGPRGGEPLDREPGKSAYDAMAHVYRWHNKETAMLHAKVRELERQLDRLESAAADEM